jgi:hypothetical protein
MFIHVLNLNADITMCGALAVFVCQASDQYLLDGLKRLCEAALAEVSEALQQWARRQALVSVYKCACSHASASMSGSQLV